MHNEKSTSDHRVNVERTRGSLDRTLQPVVYPTRDARPVVELPNGSLVRLLNLRGSVIAVVIPPNDQPPYLVNLSETPPVTIPIYPEFLPQVASKAHDIRP